MLGLRLLIELDIALLAREDSGAIEHRKSVVYFNQRFKELSDMVDEMKAVLLGVLDYEHVIQEFIGSASKRLTKAFQELDEQVKEFGRLMVFVGESKNKDFKW
ncbi:hypothetical protein MRB53_035048 [Persea americana]|uniref:Uncharacterized protein n=1 Tax=Persea americana TaxID=3435 RepID=A0ACC2K3K7_PERAE|nr:hypothetical protein MRB53_035048 [Persea americana]